MCFKEPVLEMHQVPLELIKENTLVAMHLLGNVPGKAPGRVVDVVGNDECRHFL